MIEMQLSLKAWTEAGSLDLVSPIILCLSLSLGMRYLICLSVIPSMLGILVIPFLANRGQGAFDSSDVHEPRNGPYLRRLGALRFRHS